MDLADAEVILTLGKEKLAYCRGEGYTVGEFISSSGDKYIFDMDYEAAKEDIEWATSHGWRVERFMPSWIGELKCTGEPHPVVFDCL